MSNTWDELRDLVRRIEDVTQGHPSNSIASPIVRNCCDHLAAVARVHEENAKEGQKQCTQ